MGRVLVCLMTVTAVFSAQAGGASIQWHRSSGNILRQESEWYASSEAIRIAENVLLYQRSAGGWPANRDMVRRLSEEEKKKVRAARDREDCTLDNGATHTHLRYLAAVYSATGQDRFKAAFLKGLDYLFEAQYGNGGWPQTYPWRRGYHNYITFNDGAMIGAMIVLHDIAQQKPLYGFVDEDRRQKARKAVRKGIECILKCQIIVNGTRTAWCQQHDDVTFEPGPARRFEPAAITGCESVGVVQFLMSLANPSPEIIEAIQGAITWFDRVKITGIRQINKPDESGESGFDNVIVKDETAPPMWARLYEIGTNRPIFGDHDGRVHYAMSEISRERRTGYAWYGYWPAELLTRNYPAWQKKWGPGKSVLP